MQQAIALANTAKELGEVPVGALVVAEHQVIGSGYNQVITMQDATCHAEVLAIKGAMCHAGNYRLSPSQHNVTLYVTLEPCIMCTGLILHSRIKRVVFGAADGRAGALGGCSSTSIKFKDLPYPRFEIVGGVLAAECQMLLTKFFEQRR